MKSTTKCNSIIYILFISHLCPSLLMTSIAVQLREVHGIVVARSCNESLSIHDTSLRHYRLSPSYLRASVAQYECAAFRNSEEHCSLQKV